jgi:hypothetical protein
VKELYVLRTRNLNAPGKWTFRSQTQINQKWAKVVLSSPEQRKRPSKIVGSSTNSALIPTPLGISRLNIPLTL